MRANLQEQVKVIPHLRQGRIGNVSAKDPLLPAFIWRLSCTKDIQASQRHPAAQHSPATVDVQRVAKRLFLWRRSCHKSQFTARAVGLLPEDTAVGHTCTYTPLARAKPTAFLGVPLLRASELLLRVCIHEVKKLGRNPPFSRVLARASLTVRIHRPADHLHPIGLKWSLSGPWALRWRPARCWISALSPGLQLSFTHVILLRSAGFILLPPQPTGQFTREWQGQGLCLHAP